MPDHFELCDEEHTTREETGDVSKHDGEIVTFEQKLEYDQKGFDPFF